MCKRPLIGIPSGLTESGKVKYHIKPYFNYAGADLHVNEKFQKSLSFKYSGKAAEPIMIPCGKCSECKLEYAKQWAARCMFELQYHESAYFLTLTYNDEALEAYNRVDYVKLSTGEPCHTYTLIKEDFQLFLKRLRRSVDYPIRYYMCGEYGSKNKRPHYHAIIFGLKLSPDEFIWPTRTESGETVYRSPYLESFWYKDSSHKLPLGFVFVGDVTPESCAYVARYVQKKAGSSLRTLYQHLGIVPEYTNMSLKPAIGSQFYEDHKRSLYDYQYINVSTEKGGKKYKIPRYFDKRFETEFPEEFAKIKSARLDAMGDKLLELEETTSKPFLGRLVSEEENLLSRTSSLQRNL